MIDVTKKKEELKLWLEAKGEEVPEEIQQSSKESSSGEYGSEDDSAVSDTFSDQDGIPKPSASNTVNGPESVPTKQVDKLQKKKRRTRKLK